MMQALAILHESLRHLRSRSLFWITLGISALSAILLFGMIGFDTTGWKILWLDTNESEILREGSYGARQLMAWLFGAFVFWWLSWGAIILALVSTASLIPDFVAAGSIDVVLAKPIKRLQIFGLKILGALLFMLLQVTICAGLAYLLLGIRFDLWFHASLWAIPLLTLQFLFVYVVTVLVGLLTRSPLASQLVTLLFWGMVSIVQFTSNQMDSTISQIQAVMDQNEARIGTLRQAAEAEQRELTRQELDRIERWEQRVEPSRSTLKALEPWQSSIHAIEMCVPKTADIQKIIANQVDAPTFNELLMILGGFNPENMAAAGFTDPDIAADMQQSGVAGSRAVRDVDTLKSLGTSFAFTAVILTIGAIIFCRRDF